MISEKAIKRIISTRTFKTNKHRLSNTHRLSDLEAQSLLLDEILNHRLSNYSDEDIKRALDTNDSAFMWKITYSAKDVARNIINQKRRKKETLAKLKVNWDSSVINLNNQIGERLDKSEIAKVINLLPQLFREKTTREFIKSTLLYGKKETMSIFKITSRQFNKKLSNIEQFCNKHRQNFINIVAGKEDEILLAELKILNECEGLIQNEEYTDDLFQSMINKHKAYLDDILGQYPDYPHNPVKLLNEFASQPQQEKYKLVNCIADKLHEIEVKLNNDTTPVR